MATELISLGILFMCAIVGGVIATKFKQPAVFGLLLVGALIGPSSLNLVQDTNMISMMSEFGAILILFIIGLEFNLSKIMKLGARSVLIGILKFAIVLFLGYETTLILGFSVKIALFIGVILSFSSTIVVVKVLEQKEMFSRKEVPLLIAILIIEDIIAVLALTFFSGIKDSSSSLLSTFEHIIFSIAILVFAYAVILKILKYGINLILKNNSDESVLTFLSLGMGTSFSYFASYLGLAPSAGAFLAGSLIASLPNAKDFGRAIHPYALIFTSIFFISMGTMIDFGAVNSNIPLIAALMLAVLVSRFIAIGSLTMLLANFRDEQPFFSSLAMISVGEFSLLVAKESEKFNLGIDLVSITASIIFISAILMSISISYSGNLHSNINSKVPTRMRLKMERISAYIRKFFDQLEIENIFTKKLHSESKKAFGLLLAALLAFFVVRRISTELEAGFGTLINYVFYVAGSIVIIYLLSLGLKRMMVIHETLSIVLTQVDSSRNLRKCARILNMMLLSLALVFSGLMFPFAMFAFDLSMWANLIPFALILLGLHCLKSSIALIDCSSSYAPSYNASVSFAKL